MPRTKRNSGTGGPRGLYAGPRTGRGFGMNARFIHQATHASRRNSASSRTHSEAPSLGSVRVRARRQVASPQTHAAGHPAALHRRREPRRRWRDPAQSRPAGLLAWWFWLATHVVFLIGFRNRVSVLLDWALAYWT